MEVGVRAFKTGRYQEAAQAFDEALKTAPRSLSILDSKAAALQRLGRSREALEAAKFMIEVDGKSPKGYFRAVKVLMGAGRFDRARTVLDSAHSHCASSSPLLAKLLAELNSTEASYRQSTKSPPAFKLSSDLFDLIISSAIQDDPAVAVRISHVCRRWRSAIIASPPAWRSLKIGRIKSFAKVKAWLHRSNGRLEELIILQNPPSYMASELARLLSPTMPHLRRLELHAVESSLLEAWRGLCRSLQNLHLERLMNLSRLDAKLLAPDAHGPFAISVCESLCGPVFGSPSTFLLPPGAMQRIHSLVLKGISFAPPVLLPHALLPLTPALLSMDFDNVDVAGEHPPDSQDDENPRENIPMTLLTDLAFSRVILNDPSSDPSSARREIVFPLDSVQVPSLTRLRISRLRNGIPSSTLRDANPLGQMAFTDALPQLEVLDLSACADLTSAALNAIIPHLAALRFVNVSNTQIGVELVELLATPTAEGRILLPRLVALSAAACDLTSGPVVRFIRSRLSFDQTRTLVENQTVRKRPRIGPFLPTGTKHSKTLLQTESKLQVSSQHPEAVARIKWLCLDGNANIEVEALNWLRKAVSRVSCQWDSVNSARSAGIGRWQWDF